MIESLYAWIGKSIGSLQDDAGEWGLVTTVIPGMGLVPLVTATERVALMLKPLVEASIGHTDIQLVRFSKAEVIERLE